MVLRLMSIRVDIGSANGDRKTRHTDPDQRLKHVRSPGIIYLGTSSALRQNDRTIAKSNVRTPLGATGISSALAGTCTAAQRGSSTLGRSADWADRS